MKTDQKSYMLFLYYLPLLSLFSIVFLKLEILQAVCLFLTVLWVELILLSLFYKDLRKYNKKITREIVATKEILSFKVINDGVLYKVRLSLLGILAAVAFSSGEGLSFNAITFYLMTGLVLCSAVELIFFYTDPLYIPINNFNYLLGYRTYKVRFSNNKKGILITKKSDLESNDARSLVLITPETSCPLGILPAVYLDSCLELNVNFRRNRGREDLVGTDYKKSPKNKEKMGLQHNKNYYLLNKE